MEAEAVDGDDDLGVLVDHEAGQALGRGLDLAPEEGGAVVGQRPAELQVLPHQPLRGGVAGDGLVYVTLIIIAPFVVELKLILSIFLIFSP